MTPLNNTQTDILNAFTNQAIDVFDQTYAVLPSQALQADFIKACQCALATPRMLYEPPTDLIYKSTVHWLNVASHLSEDEIQQHTIAPMIYRLTNTTEATKSGLKDYFKHAFPQSIEAHICKVSSML